MAKKLFSELNLKNKVSRSGFDLTFSNKFTAKAGEILPLMHRDTLFGDSWRIKVTHETRTSPLQTSAFTQIKEYFDFFFVPYRVLWKNAPHVHVQDVRNPEVAQSSTSNQSISDKTPYIQFGELIPSRNSSTHSVLTALRGRKNEFGLYRSYLSKKLLGYLGYGKILDNELDRYYTDGYSINFRTNPNLSLYPILAYNKIYYDFFRNTQWENNQPYNYNVDYLGSSALYTLPPVNNETYWANPTMFDLRYANYPKDLFFGLLPDAQYGDTAVVDNNLDTDGKLLTVGTYNGMTENYENNGNVTLGSGNGTGEKFVVSDGENGDYLAVNASALKASFDILSLRRANFVQKYREIMGTGTFRYQDIVEKIFDFKVPHELTNQCQYLGGSSSYVTISDVTNTNLVDGGEALIKGKAIGKSGGDIIEYTTKEPGLIMCVYHCQPVIDYNLNSLHFDNVKTKSTDYANPIFDRLGLQEVPAYFLDNKVLNSNGVTLQDYLGYAPRYFDYKTSIDEVNGAFLVPPLSTWYSAISPELMPSLFNNSGGTFARVSDITYTFFKVNPKILDSIFVQTVDDYTTSDQFWVNARFEINVVRPLDRDGLPY